MLFYNHKQEFIGIDDDGLKLLNYTSLEELLKVCSDVADLFAKEPGYIHNFKNFGWIDFLLHADSDATSAIVNANGRTFSCMLQVHKLHLCAEPAQNGYMIEMLHATPISGEEIKSRTPGTETKAPLTPKPVAEHAPLAPSEPAPTALPDYGHLTPTPLSEPGTLDVPSYGEGELETPPEAAQVPYTKTVLPEPELPEERTPPAPQPETLRPMPKSILFTTAEQEFISKHKINRSYRFDPSVAANELGLPVDLIQEFIGDFIQQSYDFKNDLFEAVIKGDMNNVKILSHKLKGVAANLRIEDAFECLSIINASNDIVEVEANLKYFYDIIAKLEGKEAAVMEDKPGSAEEEPFEESEKNTLPIEISEPAGAAENSSLADDDIYAFTPKIHADEPAVAEEPAAASEEQPLAAPGAPDAQAQQLHYDKTAVAEQLGIEPAFFNELIEDYKQDAHIAGKQIADAIGAFDTNQWQKTAIQLKGISDNLRLNEISDELAILSRTNDAQEAHKASKRLTSYLEQL